MRKRINLRHMREGIQIIDPETTYIDSGVEIGRGTVIYPGCMLEGKTVIGAQAVLKPNCHIVDSVIGEGTSVESSLITSARIGQRTTVRAQRLYPSGYRSGRRMPHRGFCGAQKREDRRRNQDFPSHLCRRRSLGKNINLGCGVVFKQLRRQEKHVTTVGDNAFIGGNCNLVAPSTSETTPTLRRARR